MSSAPYLALDIGLRRTGVALSESGLIAQPLQVIEWKLHVRSLVEDVIALVKKYDIRTIVAGIPLDEDSSETGQSIKTRQIVKALEEALVLEKLSVSVEEINEFSSTQDALVTFPGADKDAAAAAILLQDYLQQQGEGW